MVDTLKSGVWFVDSHELCLYTADSYATAENPSYILAFVVVRHTPKVPRQTYHTQCPTSRCLRLVQ